MSAVPIETATRPSLAEQMPTYADLLIWVDDLRREKEQALYLLHLMRGNGVIDLGKLERAIKGESR
jgi:hypothetical protein